LVGAINPKSIPKVEKHKKGIDRNVKQQIEVQISVIENINKNKIGAAKNRYIQFYIQVRTIMDYNKTILVVKLS